MRSSRPSSAPGLRGGAPRVDTVRRPRAGRHPAVALQAGRGRRAVIDLGTRVQRGALLHEGGDALLAFRGGEALGGQLGHLRRKPSSIGTRGHGPDQPLGDRPAPPGRRVAACRCSGRRRASSSSGGHGPGEQPDLLRARAASKTSPVSKYSAAARGSSRRSTVTEIIAGTTPSRTSVNANDAESGAIAKSHAATRPSPPARAVPFSRQTTGFGLSQIRRMISGNEAVTGAVRVPGRPLLLQVRARSRTPARSPVSTMTRTPSVGQRPVEPVLQVAEQTHGQRVAVARASPG